MRTFAPSYRNYRYSWKEMENSQNYCVILAGGRGRRLWPSSREACPKQFIDFFGTGRTQLQATYDRVIKLLPKENIYIYVRVRSTWIWRNSSCQRCLSGM